MFDFHNKVAVVTGGARGIGKVICEEFEKAGAKVCVIDMLKKYGALEKSVITSFKYEALVECCEYDKSARLGWLYVKTVESTMEKLAAIGAYQACPKAQDITAEDIAAFRNAGIGCRAWGVANTEIMRYAVKIGVDSGMTVNFPDKLVEYLKA